MDPLSSRSEDVERILRQAHVHKMRGEKARSLELLTRATELAPEDADTWELMGDMLMDLGRYGEARDAFAKVLELQPGRVSGEKKHARAVFFVQEKSYERQRLERMLEQPGSGDGSLVPRKPGLALLMGLFVPGSAQFYNGQFVKGGVILGMIALLTAILLWDPNFNASVVAFLNLLVGGSHERSGGSLSFGVTFAAFLWLIVYVYALLDGVVVASRLASAYRPPAKPQPLSDVFPPGSKQ